MSTDTHLVRVRQHRSIQTCCASWYSVRLRPKWPTRLHLVCLRRTPWKTVNHPQRDLGRLRYIAGTCQPRHQAACPRPLTPRTHSSSLGHHKLL